jgi:hypothetical protein
MQCYKAKVTYTSQCTQLRARGCVREGKSIKTTSMHSTQGIGHVTLTRVEHNEGVPPIAAHVILH